IGDANIVAAELVSKSGDRATVRVGELTVSLPHRGAVTGAIKIAIRPESLLLSAGRPNVPALEGQVAKAAYLGTHMEYTVTTALGALFAIDRLTLARPMAPGSTVWIGLADQGVTVIPA